MKDKDINTLLEELSESGQAVGIEADSDEELILEPFDPEAISIEQKVVPMDTLIRRLEQGTIHLSPDFQRTEVWDITRRSRLIESLLLKIPLPMFYVASDEKGRWEVVDGLQRLSTIRDFIIGDKHGNFLSLKNLEFLGEKFDKKTFKAIERDPLQQRVVNSIFETEMRFTIINPGTPEAVKRNIFKRINTGGMPLTSQEIRHALYQGHSSNLLIDLVENESFRSAIGQKVNDTRMAARELILRFISFMVFDRHSYKPSLDTWLSNTMRVINAMPNITDKDIIKIFTNTNEAPKINIITIDEIKENFELSMTRCKLVFGDHAFRKSLPNDSRKTPINKSLFESWSSILYKIDDNSFDKLLEEKEVLFTKYRTLLENNEFTSAISRHASQQNSTLLRYNEILRIVNETVEN
ncbi:hypothetical protein CS022_09840 [Veronia nyctiphanis]|uniref:GmrSD restriction endonucleases N-terminal domain-containing protein n=1 Tax=Veronia nyctiphanis TaxID=1278244 RepID=A0A4Q0YWA2_9GAMM|nr:DUF262 domain-containing protein [Veronia nyctiphanis]RXJ73291.1 hypothetical protein CS022_09840 [Veronia nyctiphanis]